MKYLKSSAFFDAMAQAYSDRAYGQIAQCYDAPGAIYLQDDILVWTDKATLIQALKKHCAENYALGAREARPKVIAQSMRAKQHFSIWVAWQYLDEKGAVIFQTSIRYFCRVTEAGDLMIQLVELAERAEDSLWDDKLAPVDGCT